MRIRARSLFAGICACALAACGGTTPTDLGDTPDLRGSWGASVDLNSLDIVGPTTPPHCIANGLVSISQSGVSFHGHTVGAMQICDAELGVDPPPSPGQVLTGQLVAGSITGTSVHFRLGSCIFQGAMSGTPVNQMQGTVQCPTLDNGQPLDGVWQLNR